MRSVLNPTDKIYLYNICASQLYEYMCDSTNEHDLKSLQEDTKDNR